MNKKDIAGIIYVVALSILALATILLFATDGGAIGFILLGVAGFTFCIGAMFNYDGTC